VTVEGHVHRRMLHHGYLPAQLPPIFIADRLAAAADDVDRELSVRSDGNAKTWTEPVRFSSARAAGFRRRLAIPNPYSYLRIVDAIASDWTGLSAHWEQSAMSVSRPRLSGPDKGIDDGTSFKTRDLRRMQALTRSRYRLRTDIAQCYGSIYTHSLSWALGGKSQAKSNINNGAFPGNALDKALREAQDGQTVGIPIGPQSSLAAAEVILCAVDQRLQDAGVKLVDAFRSIDDYEVFVGTRYEAETFLQVLEGELAHYGLGLNASKTHIDEAPILMEDRWKSRLTSLTPPDDKVGARHVRAFINEVFALAAEYPSDAVVSYALKMADSFKTSESGERLLVDAALATMRFAAPSIRYALWSIMNRLERLDLDREPLWQCLNEMVGIAAPLEHSYEVTWGMWALLVSDGRLGQTASDAVSRMDDPCSLVAYSHMRDLGRADGPVSERLQQLSTETLTETADAWILAYESFQRGWADPGTLAASPFFERLNELGVTFLNDEVGPVELEGEKEFLDPRDFDVADGTDFNTPYE
jgi:hypothetical protein